MQIKLFTICCVVILNISTIAFSQIKEVQNAKVGDFWQYNFNGYRKNLGFDEHSITFNTYTLTSIKNENDTVYFSFFESDTGIRVYLDDTIKIKKDTNYILKMMHNNSLYCLLPIFQIYINEGNFGEIKRDLVLFKSDTLLYKYYYPGKAILSFLEDYGVISFENSSPMTSQSYKLYTYNNIHIDESQISILQSNTSLRLIPQATFHENAYLTFNELYKIILNVNNLNAISLFNIKGEKISNINNLKEFRNIAKGNYILKYQLKSKATKIILIK